MCTVPVPLKRCISCLLIIGSAPDDFEGDEDEEDDGCAASQASSSRCSREFFREVSSACFCNSSVTCSSTSSSSASTESSSSCTSMPAYQEYCQQQCFKNDGNVYVRRNVNIFCFLYSSMTVKLVTLGYGRTF